MPPTTPSSESARDRLRRATASLDVAELTGSPFAMSHALAEVARCHRELQASASAEAHFEAAVRIGEAANVQRDGFGEEIAFVRREEAVVRLEPGAIPRDAVMGARRGRAVGFPRAGNARDGPRDVGRLGESGQ